MEGGVAGQTENQGFCCSIVGRSGENGEWKQLFHWVWGTKRGERGDSITADGWSVQSVKVKEARTGFLRPPEGVWEGRR